MTDFINNLFSSIFGNNVILATILIAMIPIIELRGAIPFATNPGFWGEYALSNWASFGWSLLGTCAVVPILALIFIPTIKWLKSTKVFNKLATALENRVKNKANGIDGATEHGKKFSRSYWKKVLGIFLFVSIPLPLTGAWTGTCIAVFIGLDFFSTCVSVIAGNVVAGVLISLILQFFPALNDWLFYVFLMIIAAVLIYELIRFIIKKVKHKNQAKEEQDLDTNTKN